MDIVFMNMFEKIYEVGLLKVMGLYDKKRMVNN